MEEIQKKRQIEDSTDTTIIPKKMRPDAINPADESDSTADPGPSAAPVLAGGEAIPLPPPSTAEGAGDSGPPRPTDEEIMNQINSIKEAEAARIQRVGERESLDSLAAEYESGSQVYRDKISYLKTQYSGWRRSRGDGNCFLRSLLFAYMERIILERDAADRDRLVRLLESIRDKDVTIRYQKEMAEDFLQALIDQVAGLCNPQLPMKVEDLARNFRSDDSGYFLYALRIICGVELARREDHFAPFVLGLFDDVPDLDTFIKTQVDVADVECDHIQIVALSDTLRIPVRVIYLDNTALSAMMASGTGPVNHFDFVPEGLEAAAKVHLLYRPGHYDILYSKR